jgi:hypothetical protein
MLRRQRLLELLMNQRLMSRGIGIKSGREDWLLGREWRRHSVVVGKRSGHHTDSVPVHWGMRMEMEGVPTSSMHLHHARVGKLASAIERSKVRALLLLWSRVPVRLRLLHGSPSGRRRDGTELSILLLPMICKFHFWLPKKQDKIDAPGCDYDIKRSSRAVCVFVCWAQEANRLWRRYTRAVAITTGIPDPHSPRSNRLPHRSALRQVAIGKECRETITSNGYSTNEQHSRFGTVCLWSELGSTWLSYRSPRRTP